MGDTSEVLELIIVFLQNYTAPQCLAGLIFKKYTTMRFFAYCYESRHHSCETFEAWLKPQSTAAAVSSDF